MSARPRIGVDLDGVVYDWQGAYCYLANKHRGAGLDTSLDWWTDWHAPDRYLTAEDQAWLWTAGVDLGLFRYGHIVKGAVDGLRALATIGDLEVVTHRPASALRDSLRFIENLPDVFAGVHFLTREEPKSSVGCDVYLDDAPHVMNDVIGQGIAGVLFERPWNKRMNDYTGPANAWTVVASGWEQVPDAVRLALFIGEDEEQNA